MQVGWNAHADVLWFGVPSCRNGWGFGKMFCIWFACSLFCVSHGLRKDTYVHEKRVWGVSRRICAYAPTRILVFILLKTNNTTRFFDKNFLREKMNFSDKNLFSEEHSSPPGRIGAYAPTYPPYPFFVYIRISGFRKYLQIYCKIKNRALILICPSTCEIPSPALIQAWKNSLNPWFACIHVLNHKFLRNYPDFLKIRKTHW